NNLFSILLMLLFSCSCNNNRLDIQLTNSPVSIHFENVDTQMITASKKQIRENIGKFEKELGNLFLYEMSENLRINIDTNDSSYLAVYQFYQSEYIQDLEKEKQKLSIALPQHQKKINLAFQYLSYY